MSKVESATFEIWEENVKAKTFAFLSLGTTFDDTVGGRCDVKVQLRVISITVKTQQTKSMMADYLTQRKHVDEE